MSELNGFEFSLKLLLTIVNFIVIKTQIALIIVVSISADLKRSILLSKTLLLLALLEAAATEVACKW